jgi:hypothetical protein
VEGRESVEALGEEEGNKEKQHQPKREWQGRQVHKCRYFIKIMGDAVSRQDCSGSGS